MGERPDVPREDPGPAAAHLLRDWMKTQWNCDFSMPYPLMRQEEVN
jgi:hypothetical protein